MLVIVDDLALPFGSLRLKPRGSAAGHNGLRNIEETLETQNYSRLRFGIGNDFAHAKQMEYVLGVFRPEELEALPELIKLASEMVKSFCLAGTEVTMTLFNRK